MGEVLLVGILYIPYVLHQRKAAYLRLVFLLVKNVTRSLSWFETRSQLCVGS
jgi:hypothetical protein